MTPEKLAAGCAAAIINGSNITLLLPSGEKWPPGWPRGELLCVTSDGRSVSFDPLRVLASMQKLAKLGNVYPDSVLDSEPPK